MNQPSLFSISTFAHYRFFKRLIADLNTSTTDFQNLSKRLT